MPEGSRLFDVLSSFKTAMLVTHDAHGGLRARPLRVAEIESDGTLWFFTAADSGKALEIESDQRVGVVFQDGRRFVSITGAASLERSPELLERLFSEELRPWFPDGAQDPHAVALRVSPLAAELWDLHGVNGLFYAAHAAKALVKGERASDDADARYHQKMALGSSHSVDR